MAHLPRPQRGDPIRARDIRRLSEAVETGSPIEGAASQPAGRGPNYVIPAGATVALVQLTSDWERTPSEGSPGHPENWHYARANLLQYAAQGWYPRQPAKEILVYCPTGYLGACRDAWRSADPHLAPPAQEGDIVHAVHDRASGLWILVGQYDKFLAGTLTERLDACGSAEAVAATGYSFLVCDDYGRVRDWRRALQDDRGYYAAPGTGVLCRWMPAAGRWVLFFLDSCLPEPSFSDSTSESRPSQSSTSASSKSSASSESSESSASSASSESSESSASQPSESISWSGSDKSSAIVPASWSPTGYVALFIHEMPEVRFDDVMVVAMPQHDQEIAIDRRFVLVCEPGTIEVCGVVADKPAIVGARAHGDRIRIEFASQHPQHAVRLVLRLTGIRRGFAGKRFPARTREQFEANERFIASAYPSDPRAE